MEVESFVAPTKAETMPCKGIEIVLKTYLQHRKRLIFAELTKIVAITQRNE